MIVFDNDRLLDRPGEMPHISDQASVERHQQRRFSVVGRRIGQVKRAQDSQRRLAAAGSAEYYRMTVCGQVQHLSLSPDRSW